MLYPFILHSKTLSFNLFPLQSGHSCSYKYVAIFYSKVKFSEPKDEMETKGQTTAYKNTELEADIMVDDTDEFIEVQEFATESAAKTYLDGKVGISTAG